MTNAQIIAMEQVRLSEEGVLKVLTYHTEQLDDGSEIKVPIIEPIHTYNGWKALGYCVKRGQKSSIKFPIWKYTSGKQKDLDEEEAQKRGYCFMKLSAFFTMDQVERVEENA